MCARETNNVGFADMEIRGNYSQGLHRAISNVGEGFRPAAVGDKALHPVLNSFITICTTYDASGLDEAKRQGS